MGFGPAPLLFDGKRAASVHLDDICDSDKAEALRAQRNSAGDRHVPPAFLATGIDALMEDSPFHRVLVLGPLLLVVDECTLSRAVEHVLKSRDWYRFPVHRYC